VRLDSKERLTKMDKNREVANRIRIQMMDLNPTIRKQEAKKNRDWKGKSNSPLFSKGAASEPVSLH